jgi:hypothetical protein
MIVLKHYRLLRALNLPLSFCSKLFSLHRHLRRESRRNTEISENNPALDGIRTLELRVRFSVWCLLPSPSGREIRGHDRLEGGKRLQVAHIFLVSLLLRRDPLGAYLFRARLFLPRCLRQQTAKIKHRKYAYKQPETRLHVNIAHIKGIRQRS